MKILHENMMKLNTNIIRWGIAFFCLLLILCFVLYKAYRKSEWEGRQLTSSLKEYQNNERKSILIQRVSQQMEEIAYQQKDISEKRRLEAILQTRKANQMQKRAEMEREKALTAQAEAEKAYRLADRQKDLAMEKQKQAEYSKRVADTLAFLALGRSLGTYSTTQYLSGNTELAALLAYTAWKFTQSYGGDVYHPAIFNALSKVCSQDQLWLKHKGAITGILSVCPSNAASEHSLHADSISLLHADSSIGRDSLKEIVTVGNYGEIIEWKYDRRNSCTSKFLLNDSHYDFRGAQISSDSSIYALSYNGCLVLIKAATPIVYDLPKGQYRQLISLASGLLLVVSTTGIYSFDEKGHQVRAFYLPESTVQCVGKSDYGIYVFLDNGQTAMLSPDGKFLRTIEGQWQGSTVTAFCSLTEDQHGLGRSNGIPTEYLYAVGCSNGMILVCDRSGTVLQRLIGHQAAVTSIIRKGDKLFSSSYDCTLRLWNLHKGKTESAVIVAHTGWIHSFYLCPDGTSIFMGDEQGRLCRIPISPEHMAAIIRAGLKRNFTREEWEYYIGRKVPFEFNSLKTQQP